MSFGRGKEKSKRPKADKSTEKAMPESVQKGIKGFYFTMFSEIIKY